MASGSVPPAEVTEQLPPQQLFTCTCGIKCLCVQLGREDVLWAQKMMEAGSSQGGPAGPGDHKTSLGRKTDSLTPDLRGQAQVEKGSTKEPQFCPRVSPEAGEQVGDSHIPWHHCFLCTTCRRCSSLSAATMGCSFCRWWLMRWLMLSNSTSLVLTWGQGQSGPQLRRAASHTASSCACPHLCPSSPTSPCPALTPHALPSPLPRDPPAGGAWAARCACRSARTAPGW